MKMLKSSGPYANKYFFPFTKKVICFTMMKSFCEEAYHKYY